MNKLDYLVLFILILVSAYIITEFILLSLKLAPECAKGGCNICL